MGWPRTPVVPVQSLALAAATAHYHLEGLSWKAAGNRRANLLVALIGQVAERAVPIDRRLAPVEPRIGLSHFHRMP